MQQALRHTALCFLWVFLLPAFLQGKEEVEKPETIKDSHPVFSDWDFSLCNFYIGIQGGIPFQISTFSSFGAEKNRPGWNTGLFTGYRFNALLSVELQAVFGMQGMESRSCCNYFWGVDGKRYYTPVYGLATYPYQKLLSHVFLQTYGLKADLNILAFFPSLSQSRWKAAISPVFRAVRSRAEIREKETSALLRKQDPMWHFNIGAYLQAGCRIVSNLELQAYTGMTYFTGQPLDGMPAYLHRNNFNWETGIRILWQFLPLEKQKGGSHE